MEDSEPPYKKIKLSLERPYKDEEGNPIPVLLDITPEGEHIYETLAATAAVLCILNWKRLLSGRSLHPRFWARN
jgi:hypothetical protein